LRIILFTGKGGTGKSVISCATGLRSSIMGNKTIVLSADPAHSLSDAFESDVGNEPSKINRNLWAVQVDSVQEMSKGYMPIQEYLAEVFSARGINKTLANEMATLPAMTQLFAFLKIDDITRDKNYDTIILDMVPSGEALRYLAFPKLFGKISRKLVKMVAPLAGVGKALEPIVGLPAPGRKVVDSEVKFIERMDHMSGLLTNPNMTSVRLVANPDFFSIQNMKRTLLTSNLHNTNVDMVIINKILPASIKDKYLIKWKQIQENSLKYAETNFYPLPIKKLKLYDQELKGLEMLEVCGKDLYRDSDPAEIFYKGNLFNVETSKEKCEISVLVPYTEKDQFKVERIGEDVVLKVTTEIGDNLVLIPLPTVTLGMRLTKAKLLNHRLHILFTRNV
jgi:arsenite-transporting ATPase